MDNMHNWPSILSKLSAALSNSTSRSTGLPSTKILYGFRIRESLSLASNAAGRIDEQPDAPPGEPVRIYRRAASVEYVQNAFLDSPEGEVSGAYSVGPPDTINYRFIHIDARDAIYLAAIMIKRQYDTRHMPMFFQPGDFVRLRFHRGYNIPGYKDRNVKIEQ